jgi:hypothetical protein
MTTEEIVAWIVNNTSFQVQREIAGVLTAIITAPKAKAKKTAKAKEPTPTERFDKLIASVMPT